MHVLHVRRNGQVSSCQTDLQPDSVLLHREGDGRSNGVVVWEGVACDWEGGLPHAVHPQQLLQC